MSLPKATLTVKPNPVFPGETVTLTCSVESDSNWNYQWYKDRNDNVVSQSVRHTITGDTLTINGATVNEGPYWCQGKRESRPTSSSISDPVTITVNVSHLVVVVVVVLPLKLIEIPTDYQPKTTLTSDKENIFTGDSVTLSCTVESSGWRFYWYRHRPDSTPVTTTSVYSYTLSWVSVSDGGQYWCRAGRGDPVYYTLYSDPVQINITERPVAVLTLQPNWTQIFIRETVTMRCDIQGGGDSDWNYRWYMNSQSVIPFNTKPEYRISPFYTSNSGLYTCVGKKGNKISKISEAVKLTVSDQPQPVLSISPQWLNPGDSVSLSCEVDKTSTDWRFSWYRTVPYRAGLPSLSDKSYSLQPLSDNGTSEDSYTLIPAGPTPTGGYVCRAGRGDPVYDTLYSEPQFLWSGDGDVILESPVHPLTEGDSVTLTCTFRYQETNPNPKTDFYKDGVLIKNETTGEMTIPTVSKSDEGFYKCKSDEGESPESWVTVRVLPGSVVSISLTRLLCGLLVMSPFLLVSIVLTVKCCRARGLCSTVKSPQDQIPCDDVIEQTESSV
ncbi:Fc receptor-like protein 5 [Salvelinus alpinus]